MDDPRRLVSFPATACHSAAVTGGSCVICQALSIHQANLRSKVHLISLLGPCAAGGGRGGFTCPSQKQRPWSLVEPEGSQELSSGLVNAVGRAGLCVRISRGSAQLLAGPHRRGVDGSPRLDAQLNPDAAGNCRTIAPPGRAPVGGGGGTGLLPRRVVLTPTHLTPPWRRCCVGARVF